MGKPKNERERPNGLELVDPDGQVFGSDLDSLIKAYRDALARIQEWRQFSATLASLIGSYAEPNDDPLNVRTTRLAGDSERVKLCWPSPRFDQKQLQYVWSQYSRQSRDYLAIGALRVRLREFTKLVKTTAGTQLFRKFRADLMAAQIQFEAIPRVAIEVPIKPSMEGESELEFYDRASDMNGMDDDEDDAVG